MSLTENCFFILDVLQLPFLGWICLYLVMLYSQSVLSVWWLVVFFNPGKSSAISSWIIASEIVSSFSWYGTPVVECWVDWPHDLLFHLGNTFEWRGTIEMKIQGGLKPELLRAPWLFGHLKCWGMSVCLSCLLAVIYFIFCVFLGFIIVKYLCI